MDVKLNQPRSDQMEMKPGHWELSSAGCWWSGKWHPADDVLARNMGLGSRVEWTSQSHGCYTPKVGEIVEVVEAGKRPMSELRLPGMRRKHESYVVQVGHKLYWPRVCQLKPAATETPIPCPWCKSEKIMAEGTDRLMFMACQRCGAHGPMTDSKFGRGAALAAWNSLLQ